MENYLMINGKKIELTEEQVKILSDEEEKKDIWNPKSGERYYYVNDTGELQGYCCHYDRTDGAMKSVANCCTDKSVMERRALQETLDRLLWRFSLQNGWSDEKFWPSETVNDYYPRKYYVYYDVLSEEWEVSSCFNERNLCVYFASEEIAQKAIDEVILPFEKEHFQNGKVTEKCKGGN